MKKSYQNSFIQDLAHILNAYNEVDGKMGKELVTKIAEEINNICNKLVTIKNDSNFSDKIKSEFKCSKIRPKIYLDNGYNNCDNLFFEYKFYPLGFFVVLVFCFPFMFTTKLQFSELASFVSEAGSKKNDPQCMELIKVIANATPSIEFN